jgi:hypothetical protein
MEQRNPYGVYVIFSEQSYDYDTMFTTIVSCSNAETPATDILMLRKCLDKDVEDTKRWHVCMRKELLEKLRENGKECGLTVYVYRASQKSIGNGKTYAFYIPYDTEEKKTSIKQLFASLEGKFIRPGSYAFHDPLPRSNGEERGYMLVSFEKNGDYYPRPFIRTLRALINDAPVCGERLDVKWCSHRVLIDVMQGATK